MNLEALAPWAAASVEAEKPAEAEPTRLPAALELCLKRSLRPKQPAKKMVGQLKPENDPGNAPNNGQPASPSADALVLAEQKLKRERELCAYQLLRWHQDQQQRK